MTVNILGQEQINIAKIKGVDIVDLTVQNSQDNNNKDLYFMTIELLVEFDKVAVLQHNVAHINVFLNKRINNDKLTEFTDALSRRESDFSSKSAYINFLNNVKQSYDQIKSVLEIERYNLFNWVFMTSFDPKKLISDSEIASFTIDAEQASLVLANTFSPQPFASKQFSLKNKVVLKRIETKAANTDGVAVRERIDNNSVIRRTDMSATANELSRKKLPFSELFRENRHEALESTMMGTIDTQHPPQNPENQRVEQQIDNVQEGSESQFIFSIEPENLVTAKIRFKIADQQITGENFQIKCIVCSDSDNVFTSPYQMLLENVDYDYIRAIRKDLARPIAKIEKIVGHPSVMKLEMHVEEGIEGGNNRNAIKWIAGYRIKRRKIVLPNEEQESFTTIITVKLNPELINDLRKQISYIDSSVPLDSRNYEYRITPINRFDEEGTRFVDVITPDRTAMIRVKPYGSKKIIGQSVITANQLDEKNISISISNVDFSITTIELKRKNLTIRERVFTVIDAIKSAERVLEDVVFKDSDISANIVYEYTADMFDKHHNLSIPTNSAVIKTKLKKASMGVSTKIENVKKDNENNVKFTLQTTFKQTDKKSKIAKLMKDGIESKKLEKFYEDTMKTDLVKAGVGTVPIYKITRTNLKTGEKDGTLVTAKDKFDEKEMDGKQKDKNASYSYKVETSTANLDNLKEAADDISKLKIGETTDSQDDGTIKSVTAAKQNDDIDTKIEETASPKSENVQVNREPETIAIVEDLRAVVMGRIRVRLTWKKSAAGTLDFFQIERSSGVRARESLGTTEQTDFLDRINNPTLLDSAITYYVTPISNNRLGEPKFVTITPGQNNQDTQRSNRRNRT